MLQWMGGSRRKVNSSRNSVQKRQKQYFEQKRRQQQKTAEGQTNADGANSYGQHQKEQRSLDVLSLLNVEADNRATLRPAVKRKENIEVNAPKMKIRSSEHPPFTSMITSMDVIDHEVADGPGTSFQCQVEIKPPNKDPDSQISSSSGMKDQSDCFRTSMEQQVSVLDLLLDDGPNGMPKETTGHEAHVAFSVEGLGKVGTETPVHSPHQPGRKFPYAFPPSLNGAMKPNSLKNRNNVMDELELDVNGMIEDEDIDMALGVSSFDCSMKGMDPSNNLKQKLSTAKSSKQYDCHDYKTKGSFYDSYNIASSNEDVWEATGSVLDDVVLEEMECDLSRENWSCQMHGKSANPLQYRYRDMLGYDLEDPLQKKRTAAKATDRFKISEFRDPYPEHQTAEDYYYNCNSSNTAMHHCERWKLDFGEVTDPSYWTSLVKEDPRDSLNFQSDESCSSSAAFRGEAYHDLKSYSRSRDNWRRHGGDALGSHGNKNTVKNLYTNEMQYDQEDAQQGHNVHISRNRSEVSYSSKSKPWNHSGFPFQERVDSPNSWLSEGEFTSVDAESGFHFFSGASDAKVRSAKSKHWTNNNFDESSIPESESHYKSSGESKLGMPTDCPPSCSSFSRKFVFDQPFIDLQFSNSPVSAGPTKADLSPDCAKYCKLPGSSHISGSNEKTRKEGSVKKEERTCRENFEVGEEFNNWNNSSSSENGRAVVASNSKGNDSEGKDLKKVSTDIKKNIVITDSGDQEEDITSSVKVPGQSEWSLNVKVLAKNHLPCQSPCKDMKDGGVMNKKMAVERGDSSPPHQLLMLKSYVVQLLCVQKIMKEASHAQHALKKE